MLSIVVHRTCEPVWTDDKVALFDFKMINSGKIHFNVKDFNMQNVNQQSTQLNVTETEIGTCEIDLNILEINMERKGMI